MKKYVILFWSILILVGCGKKEDQPAGDMGNVSESNVTGDEAVATGTMNNTDKEAVAMGDTITTETGLQYLIYEAGTGDIPEKGDILVVHYTGTLEDGSKFDSSRDRDKPFEFPLGMGRVIRGWDEGFSSMRVGDKRRLIIPPELGYGSRDMGRIPPNSTLIFDVELLEIKKPFVDHDFELPGEEIRTESGLLMIEHVKGEGDPPKAGQTVLVHYTGMLKDGTKFDSSHDRGQPIKFTVGVGQVIPGWDEAIMTMPRGSKRTLIIPPELGYGDRAMGPIPANSTLIFEVELVDFQ